MPCHAPLNHSGGNRLPPHHAQNRRVLGTPVGCVAKHPCCRVRARRTGRYLRGARKCRPCQTSPPLPRTGCWRAALSGRRSGPLHHRKFGILSVRRAPDINARMPKNLPESACALNGKLRSRCEEVVQARDLLWMCLENPEEYSRSFTSHKSGV